MTTPSNGLKCLKYGASWLPSTSKNIKAAPAYAPIHKGHFGSKMINNVVTNELMPLILATGFLLIFLDSQQEVFDIYFYIFECFCHFLKKTLLSRICN